MFISFYFSTLYSINKTMKACKIITVIAPMLFRFNFEKIKHVFGWKQLLETYLGISKSQGLTLLQERESVFGSSIGKYTVSFGPFVCLFWWHILMTSVSQEITLRQGFDSIKMCKDVYLNYFISKQKFKVVLKKIQRTWQK